MKWSRYYKIDILWNFLFGFPGETEEQYNRMLALIPSLYHFQPPTTTRCIRLDRYSPYFIETVNKLKDNVTADFTGFKPSVAYKYIYPSNWNIDNLAYYFEGKAKTFVKKETYRKLIKKTQIWRDLWEAEDKPSLVFKKGFRYGNIIDNRAKKARAYELEGDAFKVASLLEESFLTFDLIRQKSKIRKNILQDILDLFIEHRLAIKTDNVYFWLPFPDH